MFQTLYNSKNDILGMGDNKMYTTCNHLPVDGIICKAIMD